MCMGIYTYIHMISPMLMECGESDPFYATLKLGLETLFLPVTYFAWKPKAWKKNISPLSYYFSLLSGLTFFYS